MTAASDTARASPGSGQKIEVRSLICGVGLERGDDHPVEREQHEDQDRQQHQQAQPRCRHSPRCVGLSSGLSSATPVTALADGALGRAAPCRATSSSNGQKIRSSNAPNARPPKPPDASADAVGGSSTRRASSCRMKRASSQMSSAISGATLSAIAAARAVLQRADRLLVGQDRVEPRRAARAAAGHQEDQAELVEGRDERQQHRRR